jgi:hypothetical protein
MNAHTQHVSRTPASMDWSDNLEGSVPPMQVAARQDKRQRTEHYNIPRAHNHNQVISFRNEFPITDRTLQGLFFSTAVDFNMDYFLNELNNRINAPTPTLPDLLVDRVSYDNKGQKFFFVFAQNETEREKLFSKCLQGKISFAGINYVSRVEDRDKPKKYPRQGMSAPYVVCFPVQNYFEPLATAAHAGNSLPVEHDGNDFTYTPPT